MKTNAKIFLLFCALGLAFQASAISADEPIYGSQLMTQQEREEHRAKMRSLKTEEERERYRIEHHKKMQERAKAQGLTLPDKPPSSGDGMGTGNGAGWGSGGSGNGGRGR